MVKIIDCFTFYNELDLLYYRLNVLDSSVDHFVIVEATHTHAGKEKKSFFNENKHLFEKFSHKIIHINVDDFPHKYPNINTDINNNTDVWENEKFQRRAISRGIDRIHNLSDSDVIIIADLDEIPDVRVLDRIKRGELHIERNILEMDFYYYNLNTRHLNKWILCKIVSYGKYKESNRDCEGIRFGGGSHIANGGWHLSYFGDKYFIQNKIQNFAHQEFNSSYFTDVEKIEERIKTGIDVYSRSDVIVEKIKIEDNHYLPINYDTYLTKYYS